MILLSLAAMPEISQAFTVTASGSSGQALYSNSSYGVSSGGSYGSGTFYSNLKNGISTFSSWYKGLPGFKVTTNTSTGAGSSSSSGSSGNLYPKKFTGVVTSSPYYKGLPTYYGNTNTSTGAGSSGSSGSSGNIYPKKFTGVTTSSPSYKGLPGQTGAGNTNTSGGVGSPGSSGGSSGSGYKNTSTGVSTSSSGYKGLPNQTGNANTSGGVGSPGSSGTSNSGNTNTSTGVSTNDNDYKGLPGQTEQNNNSNTNTSTGVSTGDNDYKGLPGTEESACKGHYYPTDINGHWAEIYIRRLYDLCIVEGYASEGLFKPDQDITRAELVKMALYSKGIQPNTGCYDTDCGSPFMDLEMWQGQWIRPAWDRHIVQGYSPTQFMPDKAITRAEAVKVILATYGYGPINTTKSYFNDVTGWSVGWIEEAHIIGLVQGVGNGNFDPERPITRAEAAKVIAKMMEYWGTPINN